MEVLVLAAVSDVTGNHGDVLMASTINLQLVPESLGVSMPMPSLWTTMPLLSLSK